MRFRLTARARRDLETILRFSVREHGRDAAKRYELLLTTAMKEIGNQPFLNGSREVTQRIGVRSYPISFSRLHLPQERRVRNPVHQLVDRQSSQGAVEILAVIGENYPAAKISARRP